MKRALLLVALLAAAALVAVPVVGADPGDSNGSGDGAATYAIFGDTPYGTPTRAPSAGRFCCSTATRTNSSTTTRSPTRATRRTRRSTG